MRFTQKLSTWRPIGSRTWASQRKHYGTPKIQYGGDPPSWKSTLRHFSAEGGPIWIKFRRLVQNNMTTAVIWLKWKPDVEVQYGGRFGKFKGCHPRATYHIVGCCHLMNSLSRFQSHMPYCMVQSPGETMSRSCHIAGYKNSIRHIENRSSPYFIFWCLMQFRLWRAAAFTSSPIHFFLLHIYNESTQVPNTSH